MASQGKSSSKGNQASFKSSLFSFGGAVLLVLSIRWALFEPYVIPSGSMIPTLLVHDHILVNKMSFGIRIPFTKTWLLRFGEPKRGDILVFRSVEDDNYFMIKRVVGVPGDTIELSEEGKLLVNGEPTIVAPLPEPFEVSGQSGFYRVTIKDLGVEDPQDFQFFKERLGEHEYRTMLMQEGLRWRREPYKVPTGHLFMMGDNRDNSKDSRYWGELPISNVLGRALFVWLSCEETLPVASFLCNPVKLRWRRFFHTIE